MEFTYSAYGKLIDLLKENGYCFCNYHNYDSLPHVVILRHDVDYSLEKALTLAKFEASIGTRSTYFLLLSSDFYNIASKKSQEIIYEIVKLGHEVGLHFDEKKYQNQKQSIERLIQNEAKTMSEILDIRITTVSMHRPSKETLEADYHLDGLVNSYGRIFFLDFKYVSDSRMDWKEDICCMVANHQYNRLHILTHAFWYGDTQKETKTILLDFIKSGAMQRYDSLNENFRNLNEFISAEEI